MNEKISAFLDGEAEPEEATRLMRRLRSDPALKQVWSRYHLIGAVIRNEEIWSGRDMHRRIEMKLEQEPTHLAPGPDRRNGIKQLSAKALPLALAASIGALAVLAFQFSHFSTPTSTLQLASESPTRWRTPQPEMETTLNAFLVEHGEFTPSSGMNGLMSYAKFVSYDASQ